MSLLMCAGMQGIKYKMEDEGRPSGLTGLLGTIITFNLSAIMVIFMALVMIATFQDYFFYEVYQIASQLQSNNLIGSWVTALIETISTWYTTLPVYVDVIFMFMFILTAGSLVVSSYYLEREGYFSVLSLLTIGTLLTLFFGGLVIQLTDYIRDEILARLIPTMAYTLPMFNWYMDNIFMVNTILCLICIVVNFIDFEMLSFKMRKQSESIEEV